MSAARWAGWWPASTWCGCCAGKPLLTFPRTTMIGALLHYITHADPATFQPMKAAMGLLPELEESVRNKRARYATYAERAAGDLEAYLVAAGFER
jgi:methylenetetrahydrofolate--tRNA-(uracil-5-)-methyltransferase